MTTATRLQSISLGDKLRYDTVIFISLFPKVITNGTKALAPMTMVEVVNTVLTTNKAKVILKLVTVKGILEGTLVKNSFKVQWGW